MTDTLQDASQDPKDDQEKMKASDAGGSEGMTEQLEQKLEEALATAEMYKDQLLRKAAEFENYKRRVENERAEFSRYAAEGIMLSLLPILNDFTRSLKQGKEQKNYDAFYKGVELIYAKLSQALESQGLTPFDSVGKPFDVSLHDALLQVSRPDIPPHTVVEEIERGYKLHDRVLRHARVVVSSDTAPTDENVEDDREDTGA